MKFLLLPRAVEDLCEKEQPKEDEWLYDSLTVVAVLEEVSSISLEPAPLRFRIGLVNVRSDRDNSFWLESSIELLLLLGR